MKGISLERRWDKIERDVANVMKNATAVIIISPDNKSFEFIENENPRLGILAIVGPTQGFGREFNKALLAEIGLGASYPYHKARGLNRQLDESDLPGRGRWSGLSKEQYILIASHIFNFIQKMAQARVKNWKTGPYFNVPFTKNRWSRSGVTSRETRKELPKGARFSISKKDQLLLSDLFWAELNLNKQLMNALAGFARAIDLRLNRIRQRYKGKKSFEKLSSARDVEDAIYKLSLYLRKELLKKLPGGKKNLFYSELKELFGLSNTEELPEQVLSKKAANLPNPKERLGNIQLRITTGLDGINIMGKSKERNEDKDYIVFEVFPPVEPEKTEEFIEDSSLEDKDDLEEYLKNLPEQSLEDIPF
jgi:hypothetical protein